MMSKKLATQEIETLVFGNKHLFEGLLYRTVSFLQDPSLRSVVEDCFFAYLSDAFNSRSVSKAEDSPFVRLRELLERAGFDQVDVGALTKRLYQAVSQKLFGLVIVKTEKGEWRANWLWCSKRFPKGTLRWFLT